jgi:hypothetical protein
MEEQQALDLGLLEDIRSSVEMDAPDLADYLLTSELRRITHFNYGRIHYSLYKSKRRPLYGIKRGDRWFVHRLDALQWAADIANDQHDRWLKQSQRLGRLVQKEQVRQGIIPPEQRKPRDPLPRVPQGILVYSWAEAARMLNLSMNTLKVYVYPGQPLEAIQRYRMPDGRTALSARDVNEALIARKQKEADAKERARQREQPSNVRDLKRGAA